MSRWLGGVLLAGLVLIGPQLAHAEYQHKPPTQTQTLFTENFDGAFANDTNRYCANGGCEVPQGWGVWFIPHRDTDPQGINFQPKFISTNRARSGSAQRIFEQNKTFTAGIYRKVENVQVGAKLRFSVFGQVWSTNDESPISARPSSGIRLKVGIDPLGGNNGEISPLSSQVIWSGEQEAKDGFVEFTVETEARSSTIIVYTYATMKDIVRHNEVFWDDATLAYAAPLVADTPTPDPAATPAPEAAAAAPEAAPAQVGGVNHTVVAGDTLGAIAAQYNTTVDEIKRLNAMQNDFLSIGQVLIIVPPQAAPAATPLPPPTQPPPPGPGTAVAVQVPVAQSTQISGTGQLCVLAYFDDNGNGRRDEQVIATAAVEGGESQRRNLEDPTPNIQFTVSTGGVEVARYVSDGVSEGVGGHCFENLPALGYTAVATYTQGYMATTPLDDTVNVNPGAKSIFFVGLRRPADGFADVSKTPTPTVNPLTTPSNIFGVLATIGGSLLVLGAVGIVVSLVLRRRQL
jgi:LysM repeat protein